GCSSQHFPRTIVTRRTNNTGCFHGFYEVSCPIVADLEAALHCGNRRLSAFRNESNRLVVKGIRLGIGGITPATTAAPFPFGAPFEHIIDVVWLAPLLPCIHHPMHL